MWELDFKESWASKNWCFWTVVLDKTLESPLDCKEIQPINHKGKLVLNIHWKDWCWSWNFNTLATLFEKIPMLGNIGGRRFNLYICINMETSFTQSSSLQPHGLQHSRPPCPSPMPGACSNSCSLSQWCHPTISSSVVPFSSCLQSFPASGSFPMSVLCIRWPKYWNFSFSISASNEYSGLISFRMDWLDLLAVQGTLKSLLQHHSPKASILRHSAFFTVQLSHPYIATGKTIALTRWTFFGKVMSLLFNMLSRLVITFLPRSKHLLISWLQSPSAVILEPKKNSCFHCFLIYLPGSDGTRCHNFGFLNVEL